MSPLEKRSQLLPPLPASSAFPRRHSDGILRALNFPKRTPAMPRSTRIQLVAGLTVGILGLAITVLGPIVAYFLMSNPKIEPNNPEAMVHFMATAATFETAVKILAVVGLILTAAGPLYSFAVWADWFIGRPEAPKSESPATQPRAPSVDRHSISTARVPSV
jgi:hypothetical protein